MDLERTPWRAVIEKDKRSAQALVYEWCGARGWMPIGPRLGICRVRIPECLIPPPAPVPFFQDAFGVVIRCYISAVTYLLCRGLLSH